MMSGAEPRSLSLSMMVPGDDARKWRRWGASAAIAASVEPERLV